MQDRELLMRALETAKQKGASYADIRLNRYLRQSINTREKRVTNISNSESFGFGIRVLVDGTWGFAASQNVTAAEIDRVAAQAVSVRLDKAFYETGDLVEASVRFAKLDPKADRFVVFVVSGLKDVEAVVVKKTGPRQYETERSNARLAPPSGAPAPHDGKLESTPGDRIVGLVFFDQKETPVGANVVADLAIVGTNGAQLPAIRERYLLDVDAPPRMRSRWARLRRR